MLGQSPSYPRPRIMPSFENYTGDTGTCVYGAPGILSGYKGCLTM